MPAASDQPGRVRRAWRAWRRWRHTRPFWGGLLVTLGGIVILLSERAPLPIVIHIGLQGLAGYLTPIIMVLCGLLLWFHPVQRLFYSVLSIVLSLGSWITSNLGGFFVGMLLGLIGGSLAFAWVQRDLRGPAKHRGAPQPRRARSVGLDLVRGEQPADDQAADDPAADDRAGDDRAGDDRAGDDRAGRAHASSGAAAILAMPRVPLALSMLAALAARGLLTGSVPVPALAASPSSAVPVPSTAPSAIPTPAPQPGQGPSRHRHVAAAGMPDAPVAADQASLTSRFAALTGLSYDGIASVPTVHGTERMLKFSMSSAKLPGIVLTQTQGGHSLVTRDSTLELAGNVEFYTTRISGYLGGIRVTFTSASPPAGLPAVMTLTHVVAEQPFATADSSHAISSQASAG